MLGFSRVYATYKRCDLSGFVYDTWHFAASWISV